MKVAIFATLFLLALSGTASTVRAQVTLENGGFEEGLDSWKVPANGVKLLIDKADASEGEAFIRVTVPPDRTMSVSQDVSGLEPGQKYRVSARVRKTTSADARFIVRDVETSKYLVYRTMDVPEVWTPIEMSFTSPGNGGAVSIEFNFRSSGTCEIDEVHLELQD